MAVGRSRNLSRRADHLRNSRQDNVGSCTRVKLALHGSVIPNSQIVQKIKEQDAIGCGIALM